MQVHTSKAALLVVPQYADLLADQDDEDGDKYAHLLVTSDENWRMVMVKWISDA